MTKGWNLASARLFPSLSYQQCLLSKVSHGGATLLIFLQKYALPGSLSQSKLNTHRSRKTNKGHLDFFPLKLCVGLLNESFVTLSYSRATIGSILNS